MTQFLGWSNSRNQTFPLLLSFDPFTCTLYPWRWSIAGKGYWKQHREIRWRPAWPQLFFYYYYIRSFIYFKSFVRIIHYSFFVVFILFRYVELSSAFNSLIFFLCPRHIFRQWRIPLTNAALFAVSRGISTVMSGRQTTQARCLFALNL